jgi:hypothetical protein
MMQSTDKNDKIKGARNRCSLATWLSNDASGPQTSISDIFGYMATSGPPARKAVPRLLIPLVLYIDISVHLYGVDSFDLIIADDVD